MLLSACVEPMSIFFFVFAKFNYIDHVVFNCSLNFYLLWHIKYYRLFRGKKNNKRKTKSPKVYKNIHGHVYACRHTDKQKTLLKKKKKKKKEEKREREKQQIDVTWKFSDTNPGIRRATTLLKTLPLYKTTTTAPLNIILFLKKEKTQETCLGEK